MSTDHRLRRQTRWGREVLFGEVAGVIEYRPRFRKADLLYDRSPHLLRHGRSHCLIDPTELEPHLRHLGTAVAASMSVYNFFSAVLKPVSMLTSVLLSTRVRNVLHRDFDEGPGCQSGCHTSDEVQLIGTCTSLSGSPDTLPCGVLQGKVTLAKVADRVDGDPVVGVESLVLGCR